MQYHFYVSNRKVCDYFSSVYYKGRGVFPTFIILESSQDKYHLIEYFVVRQQLEFASNAFFIFCLIALLFSQTMEKKLHHTNIY